MKVKISEDAKATEYLANERTFLAWIRTSIAVISLGFVSAKFGVWLRELAIRLGPANTNPQRGPIAADRRGDDDFGRCARGAGGVARPP
jgi:uncharacterized membrane protein YidH (DUF202 family)